MTWTTEQAISYCISERKWKSVYPHDITRFQDIWGKTKTVIFRIPGSSLEFAIPFSRKNVVSCYVPYASVRGTVFPYDKIATIHHELTFRKRYPRSDGKKISGRILDHAPSLHPDKHPTLIGVGSKEALIALLDWFSDENPIPPRKTKAEDGNVDSDIALSIKTRNDDTSEGDDNDTSEEVSTYQGNPAKRKSIEEYAVERAIAHYSGLGFSVDEKGKPYDLLCTKPGLLVHVEVKGTTGRAAKVILTRNEVKDAGDPKWRSDLFIVKNISLVPAGEAWQASEGEELFFEAWQPEAKDLDPSHYDYRVPRKP